jgi:hypothetical protein
VDDGGRWWVRECLRADWEVARDFFPQWKVNRCPGGFNEGGSDVTSAIAEWFVEWNLSVFVRWNGILGNYAGSISAAKKP